MSEKNTKKAAPVRDLSVKQGFKISRFLVSWEMVLVYILILINLVLMISRTNLYFSQGTIQSIIQFRYGCMPTGTWDDLYPDVRRH